MVAGIVVPSGYGPAIAYDTVYVLELAPLFAALVTMVPLIRREAAYV